MAAADYYGTTPGGLQQQHLQPLGPQHASAASSQGNLNPPYPLSDAPPPYSIHDQRPHSQPPPTQRRPAPNYPRPPSNAPNSYSQYPPEKSGRPTQQHNGPHSMYKASDFGGPSTPQPYQQQQQHQVHFQPQPQQQAPQGYFPLAGTPAMAQVYGHGNGGTLTPGSRPPRSPHRGDSLERSRSRSHSQSRHQKHHHRPQIQRKKSSGVHSFLGAGGGAIIGDAIFPGLGTLGGAILGGLGGHEYGKQRRAYSNPARPKGRSYSNDGAYYEDDGRRGRKY